MKFFVFLIVSFQLNAQMLISNDPRDDDENISILRTQRQCEERTTEKPPFYVSDAYLQGDKTYENFRSLKDKSKQSFLPRRSIVKLSEESEKYVDSPGAYLKAEVIGVNDDDLHNKNMNTKGRLKWSSNRKTKLPKAKVGEKGFLHSKSIKKIDEFTYVVQENSPLLELDGLDEDVVAIKADRNYLGEYYLKKCCYADVIYRYTIKDNFPNEKKCTEDYVFNVIKKDGKIGQRIGVDTNSCDITQNLMPIKNKDFLALANFIKDAKDDESLDFSTNKLELLGSRDIVKIPVDYKTYDPDTRSYEGPYGSLHYNADDKGNADIYAKPQTACTFMEILKTQQKKCKGYGCQIQFGNMYHPKSWGPHETHYTGHCVDICPLRIDDSSYAITYGNKIYDREKTIALIKRLRDAGATNIYFNDPKVRRALPYVGKVSGHDNHVHFCLDPENEDVQKTCKDGLHTEKKEE